MYGCESWTVKKAERWRTDAFELWCWRRLLRAPWTARRSNRSILKEISPGISLEGMMLKLKLQYFGYLMWRVDSSERPWCWKGLGAGGEGDDRGWDGWMATLTQWTWVWVNSGSWWWTGRPGMQQFMGSQRVGHVWATELNWTLSSPSEIPIMRRLANFILFHWSCVLLLFFFNLTFYLLFLTASSFRIWNSSSGMPSLPLALFIVMLPKAHLLHTVGCLTPHHRGYLGHSVRLFCTVFWLLRL